MGNYRLLAFVKELHDELEIGPKGSKAALARELGVRPSTVSDWVKHRRRPSSEMVLGIQEWIQQRHMDRMSMESLAAAKHGRNGSVALSDRTSAS